jgi:predicted kinase
VTDETNDRDERRPTLVLVTGLPGTGKSTVAGATAEVLGAAVLVHDWAMSGLRPYQELQDALDAMEPSGHRVVGWSILNALAAAQLRAGRSVVLDGVARPSEIAAGRGTAQREDSRMVMIATQCSDRALHRSRIEGRQRSIPNWYEVGWSSVERSLDMWEQPEGAELYLDAADPLGRQCRRAGVTFQPSGGAVMIARDRRPSGKPPRRRMLCHEKARLTPRKVG